MSGTLAYTAGRLRTLWLYWQSLLLASFVTPICYIAALKWGVAASGMSRQLLSGDGNYVRFSTAGMIVGTSAVTAAGYGMWPTAAGFEGNRRFVVANQAPLSASEVALGEFLAIFIRMFIQVSGFVFVGLAMGALELSPQVFALLFAAQLTCVLFYFGFASLTVTFRGFRYFFFVADRIILVPLMMLSGTWCSLSVLPAWIGYVAKFSPIYIGAETGRGGGGALGYVTLIVADAVLGITFVMGMKRRLET